MWQEETKKTETSLKQMFDELENKNMPPIRGSYCTVPLHQVNIVLKDVICIFM